MRFLKFLLIFLFVANIVFAADKYFFMPNDAIKAEKEFINQIGLAEKSIDIAIYSFTNKNIKKALGKAAKKGVKIRIVTDKKGAYKKNRTGELAKLKNVAAYVLDGKSSKDEKYHGKMHLKIAIIDGKTVCHGSANWSKSAFGLNYETFIVQEDKDTAKKFSKFYDDILKNSSKF